MTDAELAKAVADACGIEVFTKVLGVGRHEYRRHTGDGADSERFDPATSWECVFLAAEKCGLFDENTHRGRLQRHEGEWWMEFALGEHFRDAIRNASGLRAICEAILAVTKGEKA